MRRFFLALFLLASPMQALPAQAALTRVWVSGQGVDAPSCGALAAPCRQIKYVLDNDIVAPGGEIDIRDAAGFAPFLIRHAVSIVNDGAGVASIQTTSTSNAISINAGTTDGVFLKGLTIDGGGGNNGIISSSAGQLVVLRCTIKNIGVAIGATTFFAAKNLGYKISDVVIDNANYGIEIQRNQGDGNVAGEISRVSISNTRVGIHVFFSKALLTDVTVTGSKSAGVRIALSLPTMSATAIFRRCSITDSAIGVDNWSATMYTYGDNSIIGNATDIYDTSAVTRVSTR